jgi:hypothetical protein
VNQRNRYSAAAVACSIFSAAVIVAILYIFRRGSTLSPRSVAGVGIPALAYGIVSSLVLCLEGKRFDPAGFNTGSGAYIGALKKLGAVPIKAIGISVVLLLAFLGAVFIQGESAGLPEEQAPLFLTTLSAGLLMSTFIYIISDGLVSRALVSYDLTSYPRDLREQRQGLKILIVPLAVALIAILFSFSITILAYAESGQAMSGLKSSAWGLLIVLLVFLFGCIIFLASILKKNLHFLFSSVVVQLENLSSDQKDLTRRISVCSVDELGTIAGMMNSFSDTIGMGMREIKEGQRLLSVSGTEMQNNAADMALSISRVSGEIDQVREMAQSQLRQTEESAGEMGRTARNI